MDTYQLLKRCCEQWFAYPCNLLRPYQRRNVLEDYRSFLDNSERTLFQASKEEIHILEPSDTPKGYVEQIVKSPAALQKHLQQNRKDPHFSLIFIHSDKSRTRLNCSRQSFAFLSSFYQIPASFVGFLSSFGFSIDPLQYHMTGFNGRDTLEPSVSLILEIQQLGRSGSEHCMQYLLRSVEPSMDSRGKVSWSIHQMAVYHQYDFIYGKAFWLNIKTNNVIQERIRDAMAEDPILSSALAKGSTGSFAATLLTHLVHLEWCDDSWKSCINDMEKNIRQVLEKVKTAHINEQSHFDSSSMGSYLTSKTKTETTSGAESSAALGLVWARNQLMSYEALASGKKKPSSFVQRLVAEKTSGLVENEESGLTKELNVLTNLERFSFEEARQLNHLGEQLECYLLVMKLNRQTLRDISDHYQDLTSRESFPSDIMTKSFYSDLDIFCRSVERIRKNLEIQVTQVESLISLLREGKELFDNILRYRSVQVSCFLTKTSHIHLEKMDQFAQKNQRETASMHVITFITLLFLPGTFVSTFFSSGILDMNQSDPSRDTVTFSPIALRLFTAIMLPMVCLTFILWLVLSKISSHRAERRARKRSV